MSVLPGRDTCDICATRCGAAFFHRPRAEAYRGVVRPLVAQGDAEMAKIKHIAISTQDVEETARFYIEVMGLQEVGKVDSPGASGYYLSDGDINLAILNFKNDAVAGAERGKAWSGIHHIGRRHGGNVEVKYSGPDGVMVDVSETGWVGTSPLPAKV
jgi:catechol 2,3-dioxygenase-like lactoylglutathione lyase family enzyme